MALQLAGCKTHDLSSNHRVAEKRRKFAVETKVKVSPPFLTEQLRASPPVPDKPRAFPDLPDQPSDPPTLNWPKTFPAIPEWPRAFSGLSDWLRGFPALPDQLRLFPPLSDHLTAFAILTDQLSDFPTLLNPPRGFSHPSSQPGEAFPTCPDWPRAAPAGLDAWGLFPPFFDGQVVAPPTLRGRGLRWTLTLRPGHGANVWPRTPQLPRFWDIPNQAG